MLKDLIYVQETEYCPEDQCDFAIQEDYRLYDNSTAGTLIIGMLYVSPVFVCIALAILSFKTLSTLDHERRCFAVLYSLRADAKMQRASLPRQTGAFFLTSFLLTLLFNAYFTGRGLRGLSKDLLSMYFNMGLVYAGRRQSCLFVCFDKDAVPRYAMLRSSDPSSTFLREVEGSDKRYSFSAPHSGSKTLFVFESAIDCLSFIELQRMENPLRKPDNYLSLSGVYRLRSGKAAFAAG